MKTIFSYLTTISLMAAVAATAMAQGRIMPVIETTASPLSLSMGGTHLGSQSAAYIYTNPASALSVFVGGHTGDHDPAVSAGLSARLRPVTVSLAARFGTQSDQSNTYMAGISLQL